MADSDKKHDETASPSASGSPETSSSAPTASDLPEPDLSVPGQYVSFGQFTKGDEDAAAGPQAGQTTTDEATNLRFPPMGQTQSGLASDSVAGQLDRLGPGSFGPDAKGFIVVILGYLERELRRVTTRLETFETRERELQADLANEKTRSAILEVQLTQALDNQLVQVLLMAVGGAFLGLGLTSVQGLYEAAVGRNWPPFHVVALGAIGLIGGVAFMLTAFWVRPKKHTGPSK